MPLDSNNVFQFNQPPKLQQRVSSTISPRVLSPPLPQKPITSATKTLSRARTISGAELEETDTLNELIKPPGAGNNSTMIPDHRRSSDVKKINLHDKFSHLTEDRRNSTPTLHLPVFPHMFRKKHKQQKETDNLYDTMPQSDKYESEINRRQTVSAFSDQRVDPTKRKV
ncbi:unnamed protein product [Didymodactylos carnosus]|uniref:Uncharacterized protein n=1 Tax=Didymodactylos carnosus TaxID=1234261 RepID=A0A813ZVZ8_9BILA|nr:unnamed protein product [Didymodactylos carnosus]CAF3687159.1 unnamed protein product [Didymodactylos carnosus]